VTDRYWRPIEPGEAERVFGRPVEIVKAHLRWLFAVAHCRWDEGEAILKRQPPMGRTADQLRWQHRLTNHLADAGIPATRVRRMVELDGLWYEIADVADGEDVYSGTDTWEPFHSLAHASEAGRVLARLHDAAVDFTPARPQPQAGFIVQLDLVRLEPADAVDVALTTAFGEATMTKFTVWTDEVFSPELPAELPTPSNAIYNVR